MRSLFFFLSAALALPALVACSSTTRTEAGDGGGGSTSTSGPGGGSACEDPPSPDVYEVGTGEHCFARLTPGQTVPVLQGPQGGFHIWLAVGCADCDPQTILEWGVKDPATGAWYDGTSKNQGVVELDPEGWHQIAGVIAFLPGYTFDPATELPKGTHVVLSSTAIKGGAPMHAGDVEVVLGDKEIWDPPCDNDASTCGAPGGLPCCGNNL